ncbi:MAG: class I SAM-dependent methyltransferase [Flavobacteriales bacterium]|nr:class I SAM-dependent methyltransferase [Flavobacteriales bacterium]MDW8409161.1 class I SAM-dependent methyltransferase [Flavobacteriales bacterium]
MDFREKAYELSEEDIKRYYEETASLHLIRHSDLNDACFQRILKDVVGSSVLDVGCGRGQLLYHLSQKWDATGCDVYASEFVREKNLRFVEAFTHRLPFPDRSFDTVVCTHVLEHVPLWHSSVAELKRVCRKKLIVVLPRERPYRFGFNLHLHFFPYQFMVVNALRQTERLGTYQCTLLEGDWYYTECFD